MIRRTLGVWRRILMACGLAALSAQASFAETISTVSMRPIERYSSEKCLVLEANKPVQWAFRSPYSVNFNVHVHTDEGTVYPEKDDAVTSGSGTLLSQETVEHCFMWTATVPTTDPWAIEFSITQ
ncbi:hypothetical protein [Allohahella marinimesophila]|uniref:Uncharacterized protein n=1 Tax=Allohahella marinimesophila TaxID=1054972 RepID=A0ABP7NG66_9GAMM